MDPLPVTLHAMKMGAPHMEKARDAIKDRLNGEKPPHKKDRDLINVRNMEDKGYVLKRRSEVRSDEEVVEVVRHRGQVLPRRPGLGRRTSSMDDWRDSRSGRYRRDTGGYGSDSEGSVPPRSRQRPKSMSGRSRRGRGSSTSSSSSSSTDLGSTTEEEKEMKKAQRKKWITAGLASVATIHAASKVYSSIENHDKRVIAVQQGTLSPEEAHKQARSARWQDAAAIGIAALGIKGAISEWKEMAEEHEHHKEMCNKHEEQHRKRLEHLRRIKARENSGYYKGRDGNWYYDGPEPQYSDKKVRSSNTWDSSSNNRLDGPRENERKMLEAPPSRSRSLYNDRDRSKSRRRDSSSRSPAGKDRVSTYQ